MTSCVAMVTILTVCFKSPAVLSPVVYEDAHHNDGCHQVHCTYNKGEGLLTNHNKGEGLLTNHNKGVGLLINHNKGVGLLTNHNKREELLTNHNKGEGATYQPQ